MSISHSASIDVEQRVTTRDVLCVSTHSRRISATPSIHGQQNDKSPATQYIGVKKIEIVGHEKHRDSMTQDPVHVFVLRAVMQRGVDETVILETEEENDEGMENSCEANEEVVYAFRRRSEFRELYFKLSDLIPKKITDKGKKTFTSSMTLTGSGSVWSMLGSKLKKPKSLDSAMNGTALKNDDVVKSNKISERCSSQIDELQSLEFHDDLVAVHDSRAVIKTPEKDKEKFSGFLQKVLTSLDTKDTFGSDTELARFMLIEFVTPNRFDIALSQSSKTLQKRIGSSTSLNVPGVAHGRRVSAISHSGNLEEDAGHQNEAVNITRFRDRMASVQSYTARGSICGMNRIRPSQSESSLASREVTMSTTAAYRKRTVEETHQRRRTATAASYCSQRSSVSGVPVNNGNGNNKSQDNILGYVVKVKDIIYYKGEIYYVLRVRKVDDMDGIGCVDDEEDNEKNEDANADTKGVVWTIYRNSKSIKTFHKGFAKPFEIIESALPIGKLLPKRKLRQRDVHIQNDYSKSMKKLILGGKKVWSLKQLQVYFDQLKAVFAFYGAQLIAQRENMVKEFHVFVRQSLEDQMMEVEMGHR